MIVSSLPCWVETRTGGGNPKTLTPRSTDPRYGPGLWTTCTYGLVHGLPLRTPLWTTPKLNLKERKK